jgi:hypothetical protein
MVIRYYSLVSFAKQIHPNLTCKHLILNNICIEIKLAGYIKGCSSFVMPYKMTKIEETFEDGRFSPLPGQISERFSGKT